MSKTFKIIIISLAVVLIVALFYPARLWFAYYHTPLLANGPALSIRVEQNTKMDQLADELFQRGLWRHRKFLMFITFTNGMAEQLRYGEYWIKPSMSMADLMEHIVKGTGRVRYRITFVEGWTFAQMKQWLEKNPDLIHRLSGKTDQQIMTILGCKQKPEGLFFPSTYYFLWGNSDLDILRQAYQKMQSLLTQQWAQRAGNLPYQNSYQALIVASMIEKETALENERPIIAGVILRRWQRKMRLQIDPTVLYGVGKLEGEPITREDLHSKTPYNTYRITGLPPTPIDMPSAASLIAALHPVNKNYLYYVARGDGSHQFSITYQQHLIAKKKYQTEKQAFEEAATDLSD